ncbi:MAG TPA: ABC transporter substrate-binding protein [Halioglobus sp.]
MKVSMPILIAGLLLSFVAMAAPTAKDAEQFITNNAEKINAIVKDAPSYIETDPKRYYQQIGTTLDPIVDFDTFSRNVMGHTASKRYIESLPEAKREDARANIPKFRDVLYNTLVKGYGKIFYNYAGSKYTIKSSELLGSGNRASVVQQVIDPQNQRYVIQYSLIQAGEGWKIQNIIVDGVNMGQSYRAQFEAAVDRYKGNVNDVIQNWPQIMEGREDR